MPAAADPTPPPQDGPTTSAASAGRTGARLLTCEEVAEQLRVRATWVAAAARRGELPSRKVGRYRRFTQADVDAYVEQVARAAADPLAISARSYARHARNRRAGR
ncbi:helix-turn-helix domain-containing protein [Kineococcus terrestris]|uniref:helix-turn-helix domain-containing protein n=1 Tax=Kineococcus terrestris TaxID=2044856 RepID=UPI0034DAE98C